jgi:hypothetical protein
MKQTRSAGWFLMLPQSTKLDEEHKRTLAKMKAEEATNVILFVCWFPCWLVCLLAGCSLACCLFACLLIVPC